jgi:hypothetical protein
MKFELVGFYPVTEKNRGIRNINQLGTVHVYIIDYKIDIRGIRVHKSGAGLFFNINYIVDLDPETGEAVRYPSFRFTENADHKALMDFLHKTVKPDILAWMKDSKHPLHFKKWPPLNDKPRGNTKVAGHHNRPVLRRIVDESRFRKI